MRSRGGFIRRAYLDSDRKMCQTRTDNRQKTSCGAMGEEGVCLDGDEAELTEVHRVLKEGEHTGGESRVLHIDHR